MTREIFAGQVRELVNALGGALVAFGLMDDRLAVSAGGFVISLAMVFWGLSNKEGLEVVFSAVRKAVGAGLGALAVLGYLDEGRVEPVLMVASATLTFISSFIANGGKASGRLPVVFFCLVMAAGLTSCGGSFRYDLGPKWGGAVIGIDIPNQK